MIHVLISSCMHFRHLGHTSDTGLCSHCAVLMHPCHASEATAYTQNHARTGQSGIRRIAWVHTGTACALRMQCQHGMAWHAMLACEIGSTLTRTSCTCVLQRGTRDLGTPASTAAQAHGTATGMHMCRPCTARNFAICVNPPQARASEQGSRSVCACCALRAHVRFYGSRNNL